MNIRFPLTYASSFVELKYFWMVEDTTMDEFEIVFSISLIKALII